MKLFFATWEKCIFSARINRYIKIISKKISPTHALNLDKLQNNLRTEGNHARTRTQGLGAYVKLTGCSGARVQVHAGLRLILMCVRACVHVCVCA